MSHKDREALEAITADVQAALALDTAPYARKSLSLNLACLDRGVQIVLAA